MPINNLIHTKSYEKIVAEVRHHLITYIPTLLLFILLLLIPFAIYWMIQNLFPTILLNNSIYALTVLLASVYCLSVILFLYASFIEFYLDMQIITNDRMVDIDQTTLFSRQISEVDLYQIQDASSGVHGIIPSIFNYGNIEIQTAGSIPKFSMKNIPKPHQLRRLLLDLAAKDRKFHRNNP